jgi:hypothetical protein
MGSELQVMASSSKAGRAGEGDGRRCVWCEGGEGKRLGGGGGKHLGRQQRREAWFAEETQKNSPTAPMWERIRTEVEEIKRISEHTDQTTVRVR